VTNEYVADAADGSGENGLLSGFDEHVLAAMGADVPHPVDWSGMAATARREELLRLWPWVLELAEAWPVSSDLVPPCWYRHESLIRILSALRDAFLTAYGSSHPASAAADWMHVWDATEQRLRHWVRVTGCNSQRHRPDPIQRWVGDEKFSAEAKAAFDEFVDDEFQRRSAAEVRDTMDGGVT
jgi:hypothetical protein